MFHGNWAGIKDGCRLQVGGSIEIPTSDKVMIKETDGVLKYN
jgi:hypothetical protein